MSLDELDPNRVYKAIEDGTYRAILEGLQKSFNLKLTGDVISDKIAAGAERAFTAALIKGSNVPLLEQIAQAVGEAHAKALQIQPKSGS